jgi:glucose/arabinose dehydrogenase
MCRSVVPVTLVLALMAAAPAAAQGRAATPPPPGFTADPFPEPIPLSEGVIKVSARAFATLPDIAGIPARMMVMMELPGSGRFFVNDMRGALYTVSPDGKAVGLYLDINDPKWGIGVQSQGRERGFQSFAVHPQFEQPGTPGFGKFYTYTDTTNQTPLADFTTSHTATTHDTVLLEWTATTPSGAAYDGAAPREILRWRQPFANHNAGYLTFNPLAAAGTPEFGLLYVGAADGGSGGDPLQVSQNLGSGFGKILRIDPLGRNSSNKKYGVPASNPFVSTSGALPEIYAYGVRNPQHISWDSQTGRMFFSDIGQNTVEEVSLVTPGANLGWNVWEGSYRFGQGVAIDNPRSDPKMTYPIVEWAQPDPLLQSNSAAVGVIAYRGTRVPQLTGKLIFADMPSGEIFYVSADTLPNGGQSAIRRVLIADSPTAEPRTVLQVIQDTNRAAGRPVVTRADLRFGVARDGRIFLLNKGDGTIRVLEP